MTSYFVGQYVDEIVDALVASAMSGEHAVLLGAPGSGKTEIARDVARRICGGDGAFGFWQFEASTPPEEPFGMADPVKFYNGVYEKIVAGTVYDPTKSIMILDEKFRAMDPVFDGLLRAMARVDIPKDKAPVIWGTSNFAPNSSRTEAVRDRITEWVWVNTPAIDIEAVVESQLETIGSNRTNSRPTVQQALPTWQDVENVRVMEPGPNAKKAVGDLIRSLADECAQVEGAPFTINNRRLSQWTRILYRTSAYYYGAADFASVHPKAKAVLKFCWPMPDQKLYAKWQEVVGASADPVAGAINEVLKQSYAEFANLKGTTNYKDPSAMATLAIEFGKIVAGYKRRMGDLANINPIFKDDPRIQEASDALQKAFGNIVRGEDPTETYL